MENHAKPSPRSLIEEEQDPAKERLEGEGYKQKTQRHQRGC